MKTYGIVRHGSDLAQAGAEPEGIDFVFVAGNGAGLKRVMKICRPGDSVIPLRDMKLSRLVKLGFERAGVSVVEQSVMDVGEVEADEVSTDLS